MLGSLVLKGKTPEQSMGRQYCSFLAPDGKLGWLPNTPTSRRKRVEDGLQGIAAGRKHVDGGLEMRGSSVPEAVCF